MEIHRRRRRCFLTILTILVLQFSGYILLVNGDCQFPAIFNFGDSNSDTGGLSALFGQAISPNGESFFNGPAGRYCDGRLIIDFIAEELGIPYINAFLDSIGSNYSHGANFATAGSTIRPQINTTYKDSGYSPVSLDVQYFEFDGFHRRSQIVRRKGGIFQEILPNNEVFSKALYTFDIGQNDLSAGYFLNGWNFDQVKAEIPNMISQFKDIVKDVYELGGRYFWIHNTAPAGCLTYQLDRLKMITASEIDKVGCSSPLNEVAQHFNNGLKEAVDQLRESLHEAAITYVDIYSVKYSLISHFKNNGFEDPFRTCCGHGGRFNYNVSNGCGYKAVINGEEVLVGSCDDPARAVNWDGYHFTQAANKFVFDKIVDGSFSDPPIPLKMACNR
ncbi:alpha-L-fucosidase 3-like [Impatiens glandulifera]|uniref:alpha-L-fucosidase 3-like n=1 Tax=Impatiens glandulifera TaxID=253017 RepID=UPI001FB17D93|nr:alpha-L-fucosidase 3-like [Impatiens glandulifera]